MSALQTSSPWESLCCPLSHFLWRFSLRACLSFALVCRAAFGTLHAWQGANKPISCFLPTYLLYPWTGSDRAANRRPYGIKKTKPRHNKSCLLLFDSWECLILIMQFSRCVCHGLIWCRGLFFLATVGTSSPLPYLRHPASCICHWCNAFYLQTHRSTLIQAKETPTDCLWGWPLHVNALWN